MAINTCREGCTRAPVVTNWRRDSEVRCVSTFPLVLAAPNVCTRCVISPILYRRNPSPEKLRNVLEVTQLGHGSIRILTNGAGEVGEMTPSGETLE